MFLDALIPDTCDDAFIAINKPQNLKAFPCINLGPIWVLLVLVLPRLDRFRVGRARTQSSLKAIVKDGGRAEKRRVWKLRAFEENTVAPEPRKSSSEKVGEKMQANSLFRRWPRFISFQQT